MKLYDILKDFPGSQDGSTTEHFKAGTRAELSDYLAEIVVREGWARLAKLPAADEIQKAEARPPAKVRSKS